MSAQRQAPQSFAAALGLSKAARAQRDFESALKYAMDAAALDPAEPGVQIDAGFYLLELGRLEEAERAFAALAERHPTSTAPLTGLGRAALRRGDRAKALKAFEGALALNPTSPEAALEAASLHLEVGAEKEAERLIAAVLTGEPNNLQALLLRGRSHRSAGRHAEAGAAFEAALTAHPGAPTPTVALAETLSTLGETPRAVELLDSVLERDPKNLEALLALSDLAWQAQDYDRAFALALEAASSHPDHVAPPLQATRALMEQGRTEEALALIAPMGEAKGWPDALLARKAEILIFAGRWTEADEALEGYSGDAFGPWFQRARLLTTLGRLDEADAWLERFPREAKSQAGFKAMVQGQIAEARWSLKDARRAYETALDFSANAAAAHAELSRLSLLEADLEGSRRHGDEALKLHAGVLRLRGQSTNHISTHVGQIWDEFRMDRDRAESLAKIAAMAPDDRLAPLLKLLREVPDHMPTAMLLMVALRQSGGFEAARARVRKAEGAPPAIPLRIVQYWDDVAPPDEIAAMMEAWAKLNPGVEHVRFNLKTAGDYIRARFPPEILSAYARAPLAAQKADIFRLAFLAHDGGLYVDADDRCLGSALRIFEEGDALVAWLENFGALGNNFLAAPPRHPVIARALSLAAAAINRRDADIPWLSTGPGALTRAFAQILAEAPTLEEGLERLSVLDRSETAPLALFHQFSAYKRTSKHWLRASFKAKAPLAAASLGPASS